MTDQKNTSSSSLGILEKTATWFILIAATMAALLYFKNFLQPFLVALIFWFVIIEFRKLLGKIPLAGSHLPRFALTILSTAIIFTLIYLIFNMVVLNIQKLAANMDAYSANLVRMLESIEQKLGIDNLGESVEDQRDDILSIAGDIAQGAATFLGRLFLVAFYVIFLLLEEFVIIKKVNAILGRKKVSLYNTLQRIIELFKDYMSIKTFTSFLTGLLSFIILLLLGIDLAALWGFIIFLLNYIPSIGSIIATSFPVIFSAIQYGDLSKSLSVLAGVMIVQLLIGNVLDPRLMGNKLNLSPLIIILALTFWGFIWGIMGMLLSVPITAMMMIIFSQFPETRDIAVFFFKEWRYQSNKRH